MVTVVADVGDDLRPAVGLCAQRKERGRLGQKQDFQTGLLRRGQRDVNGLCLREVIVLR